MNTLILRESATVMLDGMFLQLRELRLEDGISQVRMARDLGVSVAALREWDGCRQYPHMVNFLRYVHRLERRVAIVDQFGVELRPADIAELPDLSWEDREFKRLAATLRTVRLRRGQVQDTAARRLGMTTPQYSMIDLGHRPTRPLRLCMWALGYDCRVTLVELIKL
jgi:transcriptional regulator with XRE-family HTH domain